MFIAVAFHDKGSLTPCASFRIGYWYVEGDTLTVKIAYF